MKTLTLFFCIFYSTIFAQVVNIPDKKFLQTLTTVGVDVNNDGMIQTSEALLRTKLDLSNTTDINDATGIEYFTNLDTLNFSNNQLTSINVSTLTKLTALFLHINKLTNLDVSQNIQLKYLYVGNNKLTSLDVSNIPNLIHLECAFNKITTLNLGNATALSTLECTSNILTSLDVTKISSLKTIYCNVNSISGLDFTNCKFVEMIDCGYNALTRLNVTGCTKLNRLVCYNNLLTKLDLSTNTLLNGLDIGKNYYINLDLSKNTILNSLDCADSPNLTKVCVVDSAAYNSNPTNYFKDATTTFIQRCSLLTAISQESELSNLIKIYPNPSSSSFYLNPQNFTSISIFNSLGILIDTFIQPFPTTFGENYTSGLYLLRFQKNNQTGQIVLVKE